MPADEFGNRDNITQGACKIFVDDGDGYRNVGYIREKAKLTATPQWREQKSIQTGEVPLDQIHMGVKGMAEFTCLETTFENLCLALPAGVVYTDGTEKAIGVGIRRGLKLSTLAVKVKIHPINERGTGGLDDETYLSDDDTIHMAASMEAVEFDYNGKDDRVYDIKLFVIPDLSQPAGQEMWIHGDPAVADVDVTAPTISSLKAEVATVLTAIPADAAGLADVDADTTIELILDEECKDTLMNAKHFSIIKDADKSVVAGAFVHTVVAGAPNTSKIVFTPTAVLTAAAAYQVLIGGMKDISGNEMAGIKQYKFTVAA